MNNYNLRYKSIIAIIFITFLGVMLSWSIIEPDRTFSDSENRMLQQLPKFSLNRLTTGRFTSDWEKYVVDQIALRDFWIGIKAEGEKLLGKRDNNGVYLGKDGYLLQKFESPDEEDLGNKVSVLNELALTNPEVNFSFMLVPNSVKVLEDKLPPFAKPFDQEEYIDNIKKKLDSRISFINVLADLTFHKDEYIFYRTDHHWTTKGAYWAYRKLAKDLGFSPHDKDYFEITKVTNSFYGSLYSKSGFRNLKPDSIYLYSPKISEENNVLYYDQDESYDSLYQIGNLSKKDKYTIFLGGNHSLIKITTNKNHKKKLLIIKDSFANSFIPFLTGHYGEIYVVDPRYYNDSIDDLIKSRNIKEALILYSVDNFSEDKALKRLAL